MWIYDSLLDREFRIVSSLDFDAEDYAAGGSAQNVKPRRNAAKLEANLGDTLGACFSIRFNLFLENLIVKFAR